jgi:hypothetical protein
MDSCEWRDSRIGGMAPQPEGVMGLQSLFEALPMLSGQLEISLWLIHICPMYMHDIIESNF